MKTGSRETADKEQNRVLRYAMTSEFKSNKELFAFARELRDALAARSLNKEAQELTDVVDAYWSTSSEALGSMLDSLKSVRPCVKRVLPPTTAERLDIAIHGIKAAFDQANNPNA